MIEYVALVNKGLVHTTCDDSILVEHNIISNGKLIGCEDKDECIFAVADGVGGLPFSELASREILRNIAECNARNKEEIINCVEKGNEKILSIRNQRKLFPNISSTLCIVALLEDEITTYNLGNSRAYRFRDGVLLQLTKDQTKVQQLYDMGLISESQMYTHPEKNIISGYVGCDEFDSKWIDVITHREKFRKKDLLMLCSDGVSDYISIDEVEDVLITDNELSIKADIILDKIYSNGAGDNISLILVNRL